MQKTDNLKLLIILTRLYACIALLTIGLLAIFSAVKPDMATRDAWVHAIIVGVFAIVLPLRAARAKDGKQSALRATGIIASVLFLVNIVEGLLPNFMPTWMRIDMFIIAAIMIVIIGLIINVSLKRNH